MSKVRRRNLIGIKKNRSFGARPKHNKTSVAYRKTLKRLKARKRCPNCAYYGLGMNNQEGMCKDCKDFSNFKRDGLCNS